MRKRYIYFFVLTIFAFIFSTILFLYILSQSENVGAKIVDEQIRKEDFLMSDTYHNKYFYVHYTYNGELRTGTVIISNANNIHIGDNLIVLMNKKTGDLMPNDFLNACLIISFISCLLFVLGIILFYEMKKQSLKDI